MFTWGFLNGRKISRTFCQMFHQIAAACYNLVVSITYGTYSAKDKTIRGVLRWRELNLLVVPKRVQEERLLLGAVPLGGLLE